ncbi:DUF6538 domain-containing protein [Lichenihabitans psoromatis]|uniref:DUF6538 domain-containing protein n=1 Tax=Lichenihabitans psoromatis TaxID=2528642 RepID=UPI003CCB45F5
MWISRPFQHPKTGIFWVRKAVPADPRILVGKREELRSLKTRDPNEAKRLFVHALAERESRWANLRRRPSIITEREAHELTQSTSSAGWLALLVTAWPSRRSRTWSHMNHAP